MTRRARFTDIVKYTPTCVYQYTYGEVEHLFWLTWQTEIVDMMTAEDWRTLSTTWDGSPQSYPDQDTCEEMADNIECGFFPGEHLDWPDDNSEVTSQQPNTGDQPHVGPA